MNVHYNTSRFSPSLQHRQPLSVRMKVHLREKKKKVLTVIQDGIYILCLLLVIIDYLKRILSNTVMNPLFLLPIAFKLALSGDKISSRKINEGNLNTETFTSLLPRCLDTNTLLQIAAWEYKFYSLE